MEHTSIDVYLVIDTFLLLLIGIGPKIALVPFVEITAPLDAATKALIVRKMLTTAGVVALILIGLGELLARLLHFSTVALDRGQDHPHHHRDHDGPRNGEPGGEGRHRTRSNAHGFLAVPPAQPRHRASTRPPKRAAVFGGWLRLLVVFAPRRCWFIWQRRSGKLVESREKYTGTEKIFVWPSSSAAPFCRPLVLYGSPSVGRSFPVRSSTVAAGGLRLTHKPISPPRPRPPSGSRRSVAVVTSRSSTTSRPWTI